MRVVVWLFGALAGTLVAWTGAGMADTMGFQPIGGVYVCSALFATALLGAFFAWANSQ